MTILSRPVKGFLACACLFMVKGNLAVQGTILVLGEESYFAS
jgi:hypothetical protein